MEKIVEIPMKEIVLMPIHKLIAYTIADIYANKVNYLWA